MTDMKSKRRKQTVNGSRGFTLVEVMVSSTLLAIAVVAMCSVLRKGREIELSAAHFQKARAIADSCLESRAYGSENYDGMQGSNAQVVIDDRYAVPLTGTLSIAVGAEQQIIGDEFVPVYFKEISAGVIWREPEGEDTLMLSKRVTRL